MKLFYLIIICWIVKCGGVSAQEQLIADSIAKRCHVKTVSWKWSDTNDSYRPIFTEYYDANGRITERTTYDSGFALAQNIHELFIYNNKERLIKIYNINYIHKDNIDTTTYAFIYDDSGKLDKEQYIYRSVFDPSQKKTVTTTYFHSKEGATVTEKRIEIGDEDVRVHTDKTTYDSIGRPVIKESLLNDSINRRIILTYNNNSQLIKENRGDYNTVKKIFYPTEETTYAYNDIGLLLKANKTELVTFNDGKPNNGYNAYNYSFY